MTSIPFNRPTVAPAQLAYLQECVESGRLSGDGPFTSAATALLTDMHQGARVLLTPSCTAALELSALLIDLVPGDEVIVPSFTFSSTAGAFALMGAKVIFCDVEEDTLNIEAGMAEQLVTERTRAIVPIHYGGTPCSSAIYGLAAKHGLTVVEDNAHGLFSSVAGRALGTRGQMSTLSFHVTKNVTCGEGGALVINDPTLFERAEILREKGTDRARFFRGMVDKYSWVDVGSSYLLADVNAAILLAQLEFSQEIQRRRRTAVEAYRRQLAGWSERVGAKALIAPDDLDSSDHLFAFLMPDLERRTAFLAHANAAGVAAVFHYVPLHSSLAGERCGSAPLGCPVSTAVSERLVRLPIFSDITEAEVERVIEVVNSFDG